MEKRRFFHSEIEKLNDLILEMGNMVLVAIDRSMQSLKERAPEIAKEVKRNDNDIDRIELDIDELALELIATQQPMAVDLRSITAGMRLATDLERIGDLATDIANNALFASKEELLKPLIDLPKMGIIAQEMLRGALDAFIKKDILLARKVISRDDEADELRTKILNELIEIVSKEGSAIKRALPLMLAARHLERICDHCTNIAEDVIYMVEAKVVKHHPDAV